MSMSFANKSTEADFNIYLMSGLKPDMSAFDLKNRKVNADVTVYGSSTSSPIANRTVNLLSLSELKNFIVDELKYYQK